MSRAEFLRLLRWRLAQMPQSEIEKNVAYYDEMFSDMIEDGMTEEEAAARLGDPEEIAKELLRDMPMSELVRSRVRPSGGWTAFSILLAVVLCPIWLPLLIAAAAIVLGVFIALWAVALAVLAVVAALVIGAVTLVGAAIFGYLSVPWGLQTGMALITLGAGAVGLAAGLAWQKLPACRTGLRLGISVLLGHFVGSMVINSLALRIFYGYAWSVLAARIPNALVLAAVNTVLLRILLENRALMKMVKK